MFTVSKILLLLQLLLSPQNKIKSWPFICHPGKWGCVYFIYNLQQIMGMVRWLVHVNTIFRMIEMYEEKMHANRHGIL